VKLITTCRQMSVFGPIVLLWVGARRPASAGRSLCPPSRGCRVCPPGARCLRRPGSSFADADLMRPG